MLKLNNPPVKQLFVNEGENRNAHAWIQWFLKLTTISRTVVQSGTTAQRPTILFVGQQYLDTSLGAKGKPIWVNKNGDGWVDADGNDV